jgi:hypothetical protein
MTATLMVAMTWVALAPGIDTFHRKTIILDMSWKRGDVHYGPDFIHLESSCLSNSEAGCYCANNFTTSKEFADYIEAFGNKKVPVSYYVDYDAKGEPSGVVLKSVGSGLRTDSISGKDQSTPVSVWFEVSPNPALCTVKLRVTVSPRLLSEVFHAFVSAF